MFEEKAYPVIDGLVVSNWSAEFFASLEGSGLTAVNATCAIWEDARGALDNIATWLGWFVQYRDRILPVYGTRDIREAHSTDRTGIILGFQNSAPIEDRLSYIRLFKRLGVGIMQLTYNTQNLVGSGCYESRDSGLSDFGRDVVGEMNSVGMAVDLSHVGARTVAEAIETSTMPVAMSHVVPSEVHPHPRNRELAELRRVVDAGGLIGICAFAPFHPKSRGGTVEDYIDVLDWAIDKLGEDGVAIGSDFTEGQGQEFFDWITRDKGRGRRLIDFSDVQGLREYSRAADTPALVRRLEKRGWSSSRREKVLGGNWVEFFRVTWLENDSVGADIDVR